MNHKKYSALACGLQSCSVCKTLANLSQTQCAFCGHTLHPRIPYSLQKTMACLITAMMLYIPANVFPILRQEYLGNVVDNTIVGGVISLWHYQSYGIAIIIFVASVIVPILKFIILGYLVWVVSRHEQHNTKQLAHYYHWTELIGRWSMIDVFVVAISVALFQFGKTLTLRPGVGAVAFTLVVIFTMLAAHYFDPRLMWDNLERKDKEPLS